MDRRKWKARGQKHNSKKGRENFNKNKTQQKLFIKKKRFNNIELK